MGGGMVMRRERRKAPMSETAMSETASQTCSICGVKIEPSPQGDRVYFSYGPPGDRAKLWSRVCKFVSDRPGCLNQDQAAIGPIGASAGYNPDPNPPAS